MNQSTDVGLLLSMLFEYPTVEGLAAVITQRQISAADPEELARLLAELDSISEAEAAQQLSRGVDRAAADVPDADRRN